MKHQSIRHLSSLVIAGVLLVCNPVTAAAQDALTQVKGFYESADYEAALKVLDTLNGKTPNSEAAAYRVFCLVALGRRDEAKAAVESIVRADPQFRPSEAQVSPRLRSFFEDVRKPLLVEIAWQTYAGAKSAFDAKNFQLALTNFDRVIAFVDEAGSAEPGAADLKMLASGFRDLAQAAVKAANAAAEAAAAAKAPPPPPAEPSIYGAEHADVKRPVAISKPLPDWRPENLAEQQLSFVGALELVIGEDGKVAAAKLLDSVHARYDAALLKSAAAWTFRPATRNGKPVKYRYILAVQLGK